MSAHDLVGGHCVKCGIVSTRAGASPDCRGAAARPASSPPLYIVVRADLPPGLQLAQVAHVAGAMALRVVASVDAAVEVLHAEDNAAILDLAHRVEDAAARLLGTMSSDWLAFACFREPDLGHQVTAIAIWGHRSFALVRRFPRAFATSTLQPPGTEAQPVERVALVDEEAGSRPAGPSEHKKG